MHMTWTFLVVLACVLVILLATCSCTAGGTRSDGAVPCETVVILASPGGYVACPGAPPFPPPR